jgi:hypothetical protein
MECICNFFVCELEAHSRFIPVLIYPWYGENKNKNLYYTYIQPKIQEHTIFIYYQWVYVQIYSYQTGMKNGEDP